MPTIEVYTANTGQKDRPRTDRTCFQNYNRFVAPVLNAKIYKVLPHLFFNVDYSIWVDANIDLLVPPGELIAMMKSDVMVFHHWERDCLFQEAAACSECKQDDPATIADQVAEYHRRGIKRNSGLAACGLIVRKHTPEVNQMNAAWWSEICRFSTRDQISFPVAFPTAQLVKQDPRGKVFKINDHLR